MMQDFQGKFDQFASNNIVGCGLLTTVFYEDPLYCLPLFFQILSPLFLQTHTHTHTHTHTPTPTHTHTPTQKKKQQQNKQKQQQHIINPVYIICGDAIKQLL